MKNTFLIPVVLIAGLAALPTVHAKVDFAKEIQPLLQQNCVKCHGTEKQKGKLRLDSREAALKGGKDGPALVLGDAEKSELIRRISLPKTDDDFMPSEGEPLKPADGTAWSMNSFARPRPNRSRMELRWFCRMSARYQTPAAQR